MNHLPNELIESIALSLSSTKDIAQLARVNKKYHRALIRSLFKHVSLTHPLQYARLVGQLDAFAQRSWLLHVHTLDLSSYSARGTRRSHKESIRILEPDVVVTLVLACENLQELLLNEYVMTEAVAPAILRTILTRHRRLSLIDLSACCNHSVTSALTDVFAEDDKQDQDLEESLVWRWKSVEARDGFEWDLKRASQAVSSFSFAHTKKLERRRTPPLRRISFFMCVALSQQAFFAPFFQRLAADSNRLTHLDLGHTKITNETLDLLTPTTLTHLSLQSCFQLSCCAGLCAFLKRCTRLEQLNLNMAASGLPTGAICWRCLKDIVHAAATMMPRLALLDLGGHSYMDDTTIAQLSAQTMDRVKGLSLANAKISLDTLSRVLDQMPSLQYLDVSRCTCMLDSVDAMKCLGRVRNTQVQVLEVAMAFPLKYEGWSLTEYNRHHYYSRDEIDPRFWYSRKLLLTDTRPRSPMLQHWGYSFNP